mmetsp:Transcript_574/g.937  ORF Transcript_574/g.937 Transcript_574/m.937 type:complete len:151 (+) Transcript_574:928-1380(+)
MITMELFAISEDLERKVAVSYSKSVMFESKESKLSKGRDMVTTVGINGREGATLGAWDLMEVMEEGICVGANHGFSKIYDGVLDEIYHDGFDVNKLYSLDGCIDGEKLLEEGFEVEVGCNVHGEGDFWVFGDNDNSELGEPEGMNEDDKL